MSFVPIPLRRRGLAGAGLGRARRWASAALGERRPCAEPPPSSPRSRSAAAAAPPPAMRKRNESVTVEHERAAAAPAPLDKGCSLRHSLRLPAADTGMKRPLGR